MRSIVVLGTLCLAILGCDGDGADPDRVTLDATFSGPFAETYNYQSLTGGGSSSCVVSYSMAGTVSLELDEPGGTGPGRVEVEWTETMTGKTGNGCGGEGGNRNGGMSGDLTGTHADFRFSDQRVSTGPLPVTTRLDVAGSQTDDGATATVTIGHTANGTIGTTGIVTSGSFTSTVTLR
jgi:hypothetical protein